MTFAVQKALGVALAAMLTNERTASAQTARGCFPACREGYICHEAQCISLCNPPCPSDQSCVEGRRCEYSLPAPTARPIYEPPPPPPIKPFDARSHLMLGFHYGFSGELEQNGSKTPLDSTLGFNLRDDIPIERYLLLGLLAQFGAWRPEVAPAVSHNYYVDLDLFVRGRIPITTESTNFQIW